PADAEAEHQEREPGIEQRPGPGEEAVLLEDARPLGALGPRREEPTARRRADQRPPLPHARATIAARSGDGQSRARVSSAGARDVGMARENVLLARCRPARLLVEQRGAARVHRPLRIPERIQSLCSELLGVAVVKRADPWTPDPSLFARTLGAELLEQLSEAPPLVVCPAADGAALLGALQALRQRWPRVRGVALIAADTELPDLPRSSDLP